MVHWLILAAQFELTTFESSRL